MFVDLAHAVGSKSVLRVANEHLLYEVNGLLRETTHEPRVDEFFCLVLVRSSLLGRYEDSPGVIRAQAFVSRGNKHGHLDESFHVGFRGAIWTVAHQHLVGRDAKGIVIRHVVVPVSLHEDLRSHVWTARSGTDIKGGDRVNGRGERDGQYTGARNYTRRGHPSHVK